MATYITDGTTSLSPDLVLNYSTTRASQHVLHIVNGVAAPSVTYRPPGFRTGSFSMLFGAEAGALAMTDLLNQGIQFQLTDDDYPSLNMTFIVYGNLSSTPDGESLTFSVDVDYQEVLTDA